MKASVVIPTLNGGKIFENVITSLLAQSFPEKWEVVIIDSCSTDGTVAFAEKALKEKDVEHRIIRTSKLEFKHGPSRNQAIRHCRGEFIALLTQDSIPCDERWLESLIGGFTNQCVAGVFGPHLSHVGHPAIIQRDLENHFKVQATKILRTSSEWRESANDLKTRQLLHFFSNNNSALRRSVWENLPFPPVDFGEDQIWARLALEAGYSIKYEQTAKVRHSHMFGLMDSFKRNKIEEKYFERYFGYTTGKYGIEVIISRLWKDIKFSIVKRRPSDLFYVFVKNLSLYLTCISKRKN